MLRLVSRILTLLPLTWAIITANLVGSILFFVQSWPLSRQQKAYATGLTILLVIAGILLLKAGSRYVLDYVLWRRMQLRRGHGQPLKAYGAYAWQALQRRHRRWPRIPLAELLSLRREEATIFSPMYWLLLQVGMCLDGWLLLDKGSFLGLLLLQLVSTTSWVFSQRYTPHQHRSWRVVGLNGKVNLSFSPKTYKASRLRSALLSSSGVVVFGAAGVEKLLAGLHHTLSTKDTLLGLLASVGPAVVMVFLAVRQWRAYLRWRRGEVTMDDVSEEMEWMLEQRKQAESAGPTEKPSFTEALRQEYFEHRSNTARVEWSWALRKHELLKSLRLRPIAYYLQGFAGLVAVAAVAVLGMWLAWGNTGVLIALIVIALSTVLGIIAWIIGDDDDLPPPPPENKPIPTPGRGLPLPKTRPKSTPYKPQNPLRKP